MRALSLAVPIYVVGGLIYVVAGGPADWQFGVVHGAAMLAAVFLVVRTMVHISRNRALSSDDKLTWILLSFFMGFVLIPVYWFVIARRPERGDAPATRASTA
jgi:ACR3 family arsenite efflux pump ArsB